MQSNRLKNGICELHFLRSEISNGKKRRLCHGALPSLDITTSQKHNAIFKSYKSIFSKSLVDANSNIQHLSSDKEIGDHFQPTSSRDSRENNCGSGDSSPLPDCTIKIEIEDRGSSPSEVRHSILDNIFGEQDYEICLCCGCQMKTTSLFSVVKKGVLEDLVLALDVPKEKIIAVSTYLCRKCLKTIEDMFELRKSFLALLSYIKDKFILTRQTLQNGSKTSSYLEINSNKASSESTDQCTPAAIRRKSKRLQEPNGKKFTCDQCNEWFESVAALSYHEICHEPENMQDISLSSKTSGLLNPTKDNKNVPSKKIRGETNSTKQILDCPYCGRYITSKARLDYHLFKFHEIGQGKEKSFQCKMCERRFSSKPGLRYHEWASHKTGKTYTCELCNRTFPFRMLYNSHKLFAHGKKNVVCEVCGEMFFTISKLNVHVNAVHRNALTWLCKLCNKKFTTVSAYRHHVIAKHKQTHYHCPHCSCHFKKKYSLNQHLSKHNIFICQKCKSKYDSVGAFVQHMAEGHKIDVRDKYVAKIDSNKEMVSDIPEEINAQSRSSLAVPTSKEVHSIVINDILMSSNDYENSNLQHLSFTNDKEREEEKSNFHELTAVDSLQFDSVETLEIQSVTNDSMELEDDVSQIDVQILEDIHQAEENIKNGILPTEKHSLNSSNELDCDVTSLPTKLNVESSPCVETFKKIDIIDSLTTSKPSSVDTLPLVRSHLKSPSFPDLPVILQSVKRESAWTFSPSLQSSSVSGVDPVIHSLAVNDNVPDERDPPVTREIDITVASEDEEIKSEPLPKHTSDQVNKIDDQDLPTISVTSMERGKFTLNMSCILNPLQRRIDYEEPFDL